MIVFAESQVDRKNVDEAPKEKKRVTTDGYFLLMQAVFICGLGCLITYCVYNGNLLRISHGYDNCKNVCGVQNLIQDDMKVASCEGLDMRYKLFHLVFKPDGRNSYNATLTGMKALDNGVTRTLSADVIRLCLVNCNQFPNYQPYKNRCILKKSKGVSDRFFVKTGISNFCEEVSQDFELCWIKILYLGVGSFALSLVMTILTVFFPGIMVWLVFIMTIVVCFALAVYLWILWIQSRQVLGQPGYLPGENELEASRSFLAFALISSFSVPFLSYFIFTKRRKTELVIQLYKEVSRTIYAMPFLLFQPLLSGTFVSATIAAWLYMCLWIESSGREKRVRVDFFVYDKDFLIVITRWYNIFVSLWMVQFVVDCQRVVVAGAVSYWYFCRDKNELGIPVFYGFYHLIQYHLGSVSLGSLLSLTLYIPKRILVMMQKFQQKLGDISNVKCLRNYHKYILKYFSRKAYIEVFIYGCTFRQAGRRIFKLLTNNPSVAPINDLSNFVIPFMKLLVSLVAILAAAVVFQEEESILHLWVLLTLAGLFAYLIADCFFSLSQAIIDTMFVSFCEDSENHDGVSKPSMDVFEFLKNYNLLGFPDVELPAPNLHESSIASASSIY